MSHENIFNSAADHQQAEKHFKIFNRAAFAAGIIGIAGIVSMAFGAENKVLTAVTGLGIAINLFSSEALSKRKTALRDAKNDVYTPKI